jgi:hypothetical protein
MSRRRYALCSRSLAVAAAMMAGALLAPSPARACQCPSIGGSVIWPKSDATDVPIDTPLVVSRFNYRGTTDEIGYVLTDADDNEISLTEVNRLAPAYEGCGAEETLFLHSEQPLEPNTHYTLAIKADFATDGRLDRSFTTGTAHFSPEGAIDATLLYLDIGPTRSCTGAFCTHLAMAHLDVGVEPTVPRWVVLESKAAEGGFARNAFWPQDWFPGARGGSTSETTVAVAPDDPCIEVSVNGIEGAALYEERRCEPDRCALSDERSGSTCGEPLTSRVDATRVPDGSCDDPPVLTLKAGGGIVYPDATADARVGGGTCSVAAGTRRGGGWLLLLLFTAALGLRRALLKVA